MTKLDVKAAHEYLSQTFLLNERIDCDVERSHVLRTLMLSQPCELDSAQFKEAARELAELEAQIIVDVDALVDLKTEIASRVKRLADMKQQLVLELRYLCGRTWEQVAEDLRMKPLHARRLYRIALRAYCDAA